MQLPDTQLSQVAINALDPPVSIVARQALSYFTKQKQSLHNI